MKLWLQGHLLGPSPVRNLSNVRAGNRRCKLQRNLQTDATVRAVRAEINNNTETYIKRSTDGRLVSELQGVRQNLLYAGSIQLHGLNL